jgi:riboflavin synthase
MFTGIVTDIGEILAVRPRGEGLHRLKIACSYERASIVEGASIACSGVCMTVVGIGQENGSTWFAVDAAAETLRITTVGRWRHGTRINLERALKVGDELGGHIVAGHVDGLATLIEREDHPEMARMVWRAPHDLARFIAPKGSTAPARKLDLTGDPQLLKEAAGAFMHVGNGTNAVYVDRDNDLVAVVRWIEGGAMDGFVKRLIAAASKS